MAISRAQLLKELLPGLNALFGMEYARYGEEHKEIYETEKSERSFEEETKLAGFGSAPVKNEGQAISYDNAQEAFTATTRLSPLASPSRKKLWKITCTTACLLVTRSLWLVLWLTPSKLKLLPLSTTASAVHTWVVTASLCSVLTHLAAKLVTHSLTVV
jgi:hypothetical protein